MTSGQTVDYNKVLAGVDFARVVSVYDKGRCAKVDIDDGRVAELERLIGTEFVVSHNVKFDLFGPSRPS